jgi:hypothetical protein
MTRIAEISEMTPVNIVGGSGRGESSSESVIKLFKSLSSLRSLETNPSRYKIIDGLVRRVGTFEAILNVILRVLGKRDTNDLIGAFIKPLSESVDAYMMKSSAQKVILQIKDDEIVDANRNKTEALSQVDCADTEATEALLGETDALFVEERAVAEEADAQAGYVRECKPSSLPLITKFGGDSRGRARNRLKAAKKAVVDAKNIVAKAQARSNAAVDSETNARDSLKQAGGRLDRAKEAKATCVAAMIPSLAQLVKDVTGVDKKLIEIKAAIEKSSHVGVIEIAGKLGLGIVVKNV